MALFRKEFFPMGDFLIPGFDDCFITFHLLIRFTMMSYYSRKLKLPFSEVVARVTLSLKEQGFGVVNTIDLQDTFHKKLNLSFRNYVILTACNPQFAYKAISVESHVGTMLPCNVVVQEHENGEVEVSAINPRENIERYFIASPLMDLASEVGNRLRKAIDNIRRQVVEMRREALPT
jgi:uncharacterized protein (DUF302 family)